MQMLTSNLLNRDKETVFAFVFRGTSEMDGQAKNPTNS